MSINLSLEEIIAKNKKSKGGRQVGGFRSTGRDETSRPRAGRGGNAGASRSTHVPEGRWKHDMFGKGGAGGAGGRKEVAKLGGAGGGGGNPRVRVLLANLAGTVNTADLEELFDPYNLESVTVHFNEAGQPTGTGDLALRRKDALQMLQDLKGLAIDEQVVKMTLVDEASAVTTGTIRDRIKIRGGGGGAGNGGDLRRTIRGGIQKRQEGRRSGGAREGRPAYDMHDDRVERAGGEGGRTGGGRRGGGGGGRGGRGGRGGGKKPLTEDELNAQLDAYMTKGKDDDMA